MRRLVTPARALIGVRAGRAGSAETSNRTDFDVAPGTQPLAALKYLITRNPVRDRVDPNRLAVICHSVGGGGVVYATEHRPALKAAVALAPFSPAQNMSADTVPTTVIGGRDDTVVSPSYLSSAGRAGVTPGLAQGVLAGWVWQMWSASVCGKPLRVEAGMVAHRPGPGADPVNGLQRLERLRHRYEHRRRRPGRALDAQ